MRNTFIVSDGCLLIFRLIFYASGHSPPLCNILLNEAIVSAPGIIY